jgi:short chain dehydrogenase
MCIGVSTGRPQERRKRRDRRERRERRELFLSVTLSGKKRAFILVSFRSRGGAMVGFLARSRGLVCKISSDSDGFPRATAKRFVKEGAYVFTTGRREPELAAAVKEIGKNVTGVPGDVSNLADLDRLFAQIEQEKGRLDIVFANAGTAKYARFGTITEELYDSIFDVNVKGLLFKVQKSASIVAGWRLDYP